MCVKDWWNLWQKRKGLALAVLAFVLGQAYFGFKGVETFPWLHFGMFSAPYQSPPEYLDLEQGLHSVLEELPAKKREFVVQNAKFWLHRHQNGAAQSPVAEAIDQRFPSAKFPQVHALLHENLNQSHLNQGETAAWFYGLESVNPQGPDLLLIRYKGIGENRITEYFTLPKPNP